MSDAITVVVAVYNQEGYTRACLDAIFRHSPPDTQVVVWDNGSTDPIRQLCSCYPKGRLEYHRSEKNVGVPEAYNQCLRTLVRTDRVCFVHNDVIVTPEWLDRMAAHLSGQKAHAVVCPRTNYCDKASFVYDVAIAERTSKNKPPNKAIGRITTDLIRVVLKSTFGEDGLDGFARQVSEKAMGAARSAVEVGDFCFLTKTETLAAIGGFDERLGPHTYWDMELRDRLENFGYGICIADDVFVHHHGNLTSDGPGFDFRRLLGRNRGVYDKLCREGRRGDGSSLYRVEMDDGSGEPPDLIVFTPYYVPHAPGGAEISLHMALRNCAGFGVPVEAHCFLDERGEKFQYGSESVVDGVRVIRHRSCDEIRFADAAREVLVTKEPRSALFQGDRVKQAAMACATLDTKTRISWFFRNMDEILRPNTYGIRMHKVLRKLRGPIFANSRFLADRVKEEYGRKCVVVLPSISEEVRVKTERKYLTCMAATEEKGIRTVMRMADRMPHQRFLVAGPAPPSVAAEMSEKPNIEYLGPLRDPRAAYSKTRILLVPSLVHDSSPRVILEAQASGIPVVGTDNGGIRDMIGRGGICLPSPCDDGDFVGAVTSMDNDQAYKEYCKLAEDNFAKFGRHRGPYLFRSAITSALRDRESRAHEGSVAELIQSLNRSADPFRLVRAAIVEKSGLNRTDAMGYILGRLNSSQDGGPMSQMLDAAAANFGGTIEAVRSIRVKHKLGCQKILVTMKPRSGGGGVLTVLNLVRGLREAGHDAHFLEVGNQRTLICRVNGEEVPKRERCSLYSLLLRDKISSPIMSTLLNPDIVVFDDVERIWEPKVLDLAHKRFFLLCCGLPGVHPPYYLTDWITGSKKVRKFEKVFVRNMSFYRYLDAMAPYDSAYENRIVSWQGGCEYETLRKEYGHCEYPEGRDALLGTFSKWEWWKGPQLNLLAAMGVSRMLPKRDVRWYVPMAWPEHRTAARHGRLKIEYGVQRAKGSIVAQKEVFARMRKCHVGLELAFSDAFPRSVNEAMNLGLPMVVSSAIEHVRENRDYEELCVVQNPNDILCAAQKVAKLLTDRDAWLVASNAAMEIGSKYHASREAEIFIKEAGLPILT